MGRETGYAQLLKSYKRMEKENQKLRKMLSLENISALEILVRDCVKYNRDQIRKIAVEMQLTDYDTENVERVMSLIKFLQNMCRELNAITEVRL